jgi:hypothetical protein
LGQLWHFLGFPLGSMRGDPQPPYCGLWKANLLYFLRTTFSTPSGASCGGEPRRLRSKPQVFDLLARLIESRERVVGKDGLAPTNSRRVVPLLRRRPQSPPHNNFLSAVVEEGQFVA